MGKTETPFGNTFCGWLNMAPLICCHRSFVMDCSFRLQIFYVTQFCFSFVKVSFTALYECLLSEPTLDTTGHSDQKCVNSGAHVPWNFLISPTSRAWNDVMRTVLCPSEWRWPDLGYPYTWMHRQKRKSFFLCSEQAKVYIPKRTCHRTCC